MAVDDANEARVYGGPSRNHLRMHRSSLINHALPMDQLHNLLLGLGAPIVPFCAAYHVVRWIAERNGRSEQKRDVHAGRD